MKPKRPAGLSNESAAEAKPKPKVKKGRAEKMTGSTQKASIGSSMSSGRAPHHGRMRVVEPSKRRRPRYVTCA